MNCAKCNSNDQNVSIVVSGGNSFFLCEDCFKKNNELPTGLLSKENWVKRNIKEAKERRDSGEGYWK